MIIRRFQSQMKWFLSKSSNKQFNPQNVNKFINEETFPRLLGKFFHQFDLNNSTSFDSSSIRFPNYLLFPTGSF